MVTWLWVTGTSRCQRRRWHRQREVCPHVAFEGSVSSTEASPKSFAGPNEELVAAVIPMSSLQSPSGLPHCTTAPNHPSAPRSSPQPGSGAREHVLKPLNTLKYIHSKVLGKARGCTGRRQPAPVPARGDWDCPACYRYRTLSTERVGLHRLVLITHERSARTQTSHSEKAGWSPRSTRGLFINTL